MVVSASANKMQKRGLVASPKHPREGAGSPRQGLSEDEDLSPEVRWAGLGWAGQGASVCGKAFEGVRGRAAKGHGEHSVCDRQLAQLCQRYGCLAQQCSVCWHPAVALALAAGVQEVGVSE